MPTTSAFVSGRQVTVDNEQFNIKFTKTVEQLNAGLSKAQKALGLFYDENQRLNDGLGRCVEGLSAWQLKLGMWVDETGRARTVTGGFADGLSRAELELGNYADEIGKVFNRQNEEIRQTQKYIDSLKEESDALRETREAFADAFDSFGDGAGRLASLLSQIDGLNGQAASLQQNITKLLGAVDAASQAFTAFRGVGEGLKSLKTSILAMNAAMKASATTAQGLKAAVAAIGGPWTIVAAGVAAAVAAMTLFNNETEDASKKSVEATDKISESFEKVKQRAKEAGAEIRGLNDVLKYGAFYQEDNSLTSLEADLKKKNEEIAVLQEEAKKAESARQTAVGGGMGGAGAVGSVLADVDLQAPQKLKEAQQKRDELQSQYNDVASDLIAKLREENTTEEQKAEALKKQYQTLLKHAQSDEDREMIANKIKAIDDGIAESKKKELDEQQKKLEAQRATLAKDLGISFDFTPVKTQEEKLADDLKKLRDAFKADLDMLDCVNWALEEAEALIWQKYSDESPVLFDSCKKSNKGTNVRRVLQFRGDKRYNESQPLYFL